MATIEPTILPMKHHPEHPAAEICPWCEQPIPRDKFNEIQKKIQTKERERGEETKRALRAQFAKEKAQAEAAAREEGKKAAEAATTDRITAAEEAKVAAERQLKAATDGHESAMSRRLLEVREALGKDKSDAVLAEQAKAFEERQKFEATVHQLKRQIEQKTAEELGEGAELDLFEKLKEGFEDDRIRRVAKGTAGADIIHEVLHNGKVCGKIVYDAKNRNAWRNDYAAKLRADQIAERADCAVLSTNKFPAGTRQLLRQDGVIITCPARVVAIAEILRSQIVQMHELRASNEERDEKTAAIYAFITSERFSQLLDSIETDVEKLEKVDVAEIKAHDATWQKRGKLQKAILKSRGNLCFEVSRIIGTAEDAE